MLGDDPREWLRSALCSQCRDARIVDAILATPRDRYVAREWRAFAWEDRALPYAEGQTISQPTMIAILLEALEPRPDDVVLDVGTGSGYQAGVLARLVRRVYGIEVIRSLAQRARASLASDPGLPDNVRLVVGDAWRGFPAALRFDGIAVAAAASEVPAALAEQLAPGGRLVVPIGSAGTFQDLVRVRRRRDGSFAEAEILGACAFVPLVHAG